MGASGWFYFVPYQEDAALALSLLHRRIVAEKEYFDTWLSEHIPYKYWKDLNEVWGNLHPSWIEAAGREQGWESFAQAVLKKFASVLEEKHIAVALPKPPTIEELLHRYSQGTHSILDIRRVADQPGLQVATSLSREEQLTVLGTEKPTRARAELALTTRGKPGEKSLYTLRGRWQAVYFTVYLDDRPDEICFCGRSGD